MFEARRQRLHLDEGVVEDPERGLCVRAHAADRRDGPNRHVSLPLGEADDVVELFDHRARGGHTAVKHLLGQQEQEATSTPAQDLPSLDAQRGGSFDVGRLIFSGCGGSSTCACSPCWAGGESYGYELGQALERAGLGAIQGGTLYPVLLRPQRTGSVTTRWQEGEGGPARKYYRITDAGRDGLARDGEDWLAFAASVAKLLDEGTTDEREVMAVDASE